MARVKRAARSAGWGGSWRDGRGARERLADQPRAADAHHLHGAQLAVEIKLDRPRPDHSRPQLDAPPHARADPGDLRRAVHSTAVRIRWLGVTLLTVAIAACGGTPASIAPSSAPSPSPTTSTELVADVDVGGRTMHLVCVGPTRQITRMTWATFRSGAEALWSSSGMRRTRRRRPRDRERRWRRRTG